MSWMPLQSRLLRIDWRSKAALAIDPYLAWADATRLAGVRATLMRADSQVFDTQEKLSAATVSIAFELAGDATIEAVVAALRSWRPGVPWWPIGIGSQFGTLSVPIGLLRWFYFEPLQRLFKRIELGLPTRAPDDTELFVSSLLGEATIKSIPAPAKTTYAAVIDDGCAFANLAFIEPHSSTAPKSRIHRLWFQEDMTPIDSGGAHLGYATSHLNGFLGQGSRAGRLNESAAYAALEADLRRRGLDEAADSWQRQMRLPATHGTHMLDVMAGAPNPLARRRYGYGRPQDPACGTPLIFVQLPRGAVADTSGGSMNSNVLEALAYIARAVRRQDQVVVNLSYGALAGPHDGTTLLEEAIDDFLHHNTHVKALTLPAGNGYDSCTHARQTATDDGVAHEMLFRLLPADPTDTYVELWYSPKDATATGTATLDFQVVTPDGASSGWVALGDFVEWPGSGTTPIAALIHVERPTGGGGHKHMALLALAPTHDPQGTRGTVPHGQWTLQVRNRGDRQTVVDAWIERDDSAFGSGRSRSQAVFVSVGMPPARGANHAATVPIERQACLNSFAHGSGPKVAGGYCLRYTVAGTVGRRTQAPARYSASGPGRKGAYLGPNVCAPCEEFRGVGLLAAGTRSAQPAYMDGTSVASAALARQTVNSLVLSSPIPPPNQTALLPDPPKRSAHVPYSDPKFRRGDGRLEPVP